MILRSLVVFGLLGAVPATAQTPGKGVPATRDVIVLGQRKAEVKRESYKYLESMLPRTPADAPMARFEEIKVCPIALGLTPGLDRAITDRLRHIAAVVKIDLDKPDCKLPNALVLFADDLKPMLALLEKRYVGMFVDRYGMPVHFDRKGPVVVWHLSTVANQNGTVLNQQEIGGNLINRTARQGSRLEASVHEPFTLKVVLIERGAVAGLTAIQVADYAAMRVFADTKPPSRGSETDGDAPRTILAAIDAPMGSPVPETLTAWDLGLLRGLYSVSSNLLTSQQRGEVATAITRGIMEPARGR